MHGLDTSNVSSRVESSQVEFEPNTWFDNCRDVGDALCLTFIWSCRVPVAQAIRDSGAGEHAAVDLYSMCREVAEVVMTNEIKDHPLGGEGMYSLLRMC